MEIIRPQPDSLVNSRSFVCALLLEYRCQCGLRNLNPCYLWSITAGERVVGFRCGFEHFKANLTTNSTNFSDFFYDVSIVYNVAKKVSRFSLRNCAQRENWRPNSFLRTLPQRNVSPDDSVGVSLRLSQRYRMNFKITLTTRSDDRVCVCVNVQLSV